MSQTECSLSDENSSTSTSSSSVPAPKPIQLRASMLRPSAFSAQMFPSPPSPSKSTADATPATAPAEENSSTAPEPEKQETATKTPDNDNEDPLAKLARSSNGLARSNPFISVKVTPLASDSGFVFGQNTRERVTGTVNEDEGSKSNGGDLTFSTAAPSTSASDGDEPAVGGSKDGKSLSEVAAEYEETKNARKRKFEEVETFTGEEDEINVLDITCKLYTFLHVYEERGRGSLRLNDAKDGGGSRLVFRTTGNLRVLLNTKVWDGMIAEPAGAKSLRITGIDSTGQVKIYLVMARPSDIQTLTNALQNRISAEKLRVASKDPEKEAENGEGKEGEEKEAKSEEVEESQGDQEPLLKKQAVDDDV